MLQQRNVLLDYAFVFINVIYAGYATTFVRSTETWESILGLTIPIIFSVVIGYYYRVSFSRSFVYLIIGFIAYNIALTLKFGVLHPRFMGIYLFNFYITYIIIASMRYRFFIYYENTIYFLSICALLFWGIQNAMPNLINTVSNLFAFSTPGSGNVEANFIIYTISNVTSFEGTKINLGSISIIRNAGFTWEAGAFACHLNLAIFINLIRSKFRIVSNIRFWILFLTLITTFSTTGFSLFMLLTIFYIYNQHIKYTIFLAPLAIALGIYISTLPFMGEKIIDLNNYNTKEMIESAITYNTNPTPQRFESLQIDFIDFVNNPILGYGGHMAERWTAKLGVNISTISGIGKVMAMFGIVGIVFFFSSLFYTSKDFTKMFGFKGWVFPFLMIIMISLSYSIIFGPILMCFWLINSKYLTKAGKLSYYIDRIKMIRMRYRTT